MKKICVVTGTRAEYGLLYWVMKGIQASSNLQLQLIVTGMHLAPEFGLTVTDIENDGFSIDSKIEMLMSSDTPIGITKSMGLGLIGFADALDRLRPDLILLLGDRYEIFVAATAAMVACVPVAHIHGGESTEGLIDEPIRHGVSKMSHIHFVATEEYRKRVIQLGEHPTSVENVGGMGVDCISRTKLLTRSQTEKSIGFNFLERNLLITFHPVTLDYLSAELQMEELLCALRQLDDVGLIFTMPNADTNGRIIFKMIKSFCDDSQNSACFSSLGHLRYFSCMKYVDGLIGNSSSGLIEAPSLKVGTINIGDRQRGRQRAKSVIDCPADAAEISKSIKYLFSSKFKKLLESVDNPYGEGGSSDKIVATLQSHKYDGLLKKRFYDLPV